VWPLEDTELAPALRLITTLARADMGVLMLLDDAAHLRMPVLGYGLTTSQYECFERINSDTGGAFGTAIAEQLVALGISMLNFILLPLWRGQTIGKWATGLCIESLDGGELGVGLALLRHLVGYPLSLVTLGLGFLVAAFSTHGRALHDLIAGTVVVRDTGRAPRPRARP
jgi:hypothetical protein